MKLITIVLCKLLSFVGKLLGRGSSLPGSIALKLCPNILSRLTLPEHIIAVTGSNGKTSTVEMIAAILQKAGKKVVYNKEGSNQIEGVTTLLLKSATLSGKVPGDIVLLESDERFARLTFKHIKPTVFIVGNLYRDQLTRNSHPFRVYGAIKDAVDLIPNAKLVLNADDPIVRNLGFGRENTEYYGMEKNAYSMETTDAVFNDCYYCPRCKGKMEFEYFHYTHLGQYHCPHCDYDRPRTAYSVDSMDFEKNEITINGDAISLEFASKYNVYNLCAAYAAASLMGLEGKQIAQTLNDFVMKNGRIVRFLAGSNPGMLLASKHENSTSYNQNLQYVCADKEESDLVVLVDAISRKYYTAETSWLWDVSFHLLKDSNVQRIYLTGKYAYDLALRFELLDLGGKEVIVEPDLDKMAAAISEDGGRKLYAVTCFSDKEKLLNRMESVTVGIK